MSSERAQNSDLSRVGESVNTSIAESLRTAAGALTRRNEAGSNEGLSGLGNRAAELLNRSADYVEELDLAKVKDSVVSQVRRNPGRSLLIAGAAGLFLGALFRRR
jgi:ElaB/YqjD/DUF883 family membrane-anchored ribosome-binding protein